MNINTYELEIWRDGHGELVAQDVQHAREIQATFLQQLSQAMINIGHRVTALGQRLQMTEGSMQLQN